MTFRRRNHPQRVAHKGNSWDHPENTAAAVRSAVELAERAEAPAVDMVEVDVCRTADGVLVGLHGPRLESSTDGAGLVADQTWDVVSGLRTRDRTGRLTDEGVPRLVDLVEAFDPPAWNLDVKDQRAALDVAAFVVRMGLVDRVVVSGLTGGVVHDVLDAPGGVHVLVGLTRFDKVLAATPLKRWWLLRRYRRVLGHDRVVALNVPARFVDASLVAAVVAVGAEVWAYTIDETPEFLRVLGTGVHSITTNRPAAI